MISAITSLFQPLALLVSLIVTSNRALGIVVLTTGTLAGLFGYQGLGHLKGLLRQLLVGLPVGACFGLLSLVIDSQTQFTFSSALEELLPLFSGPFWHYFLFGTVGFVSGLLEPLIDPNFFRIQGSRLKLWRQSVVLIVFTIDVSLGIAVLLQVYLTRTDLLGSIQVPRLLVLVLSLIIGALLALTYSQVQKNSGRDSQPGSSPAPAREQALQIVNSAVLVIASLVMMLFSGFYVVAIQGWFALLDLPLLAVMFVFAYRLQALLDRDNDDDKLLIYVSLGFFVAAVILQFYQLVHA